MNWGYFCAFKLEQSSKNKTPLSGELLIQTEKYLDYQEVDGEVAPIMVLRPK